MVATFPRFECALIRDLGGGVGKKFNVLRNRVEPASYEVDQLLLGTILFTLTTFLFPTVLAYYLAFAAVRPLSPSCFPGSLAANTDNTFQFLGKNRVDWE